MLPRAAFQLTDLSVTVPCTVAANCSAPPVVVEPDAGDTVTDVTDGLGGAAVTVTVADANFVGSALLVAVTVSVPVFEGAVYRPEELTLPSSALQVTALFGVVP